MKTKYEDSLFYHIHSTAKFFDKLFEQFFKEIDLGVNHIEHLALIIIHDLKDCCQRDLARIILKDRANTGKLVQSLEKKGLVKIKLSTKNNRPVNILTVTKKGKDLVNESEILFEPIKNKIEENYSKEKINEIKKSLQTFKRTIEKVVKTNI